ncbi:acylphosphatase [Candidatus Chromulinivorax destructor]|uniref:Acylphosphatase-like domain-containing protein n=1 Tax=Candidatus Chromulinivorax destructor TaxID=2066483 RepID=A0A345ZB63_9BACT|nr:acylphosphatase [Candidatus Chromulinivorax destructor]AXK60530.1 hypothetical protein C0J27_02105 [Candidatus Chromulinivorax destructor]
MKKCVKLLFEVQDGQKILESFIADQAALFKIEGIGQEMHKDSIQLFICGQEEQVDDFIDAMYVGKESIQLKNIKIETCSTDRSYRGVFRIVE